MFACLALALVFALAAVADDAKYYTRGNAEMGHGAPINNFAKASRDTAYLIGPLSDSPVVLGSFQNAAGTSGDWHGWTTNDLSSPDMHWQVSTFMADTLGGGLPGSGNLAAYCGDDFPPCSAYDKGPGGYGDGWFDQLDYVSTITDDTMTTNIHFEADLNYDSEPGYDYSYIGYVSALDGFVFLESFTFRGWDIHVSYDFTVGQDDFLGEFANQVRLRVLFQSDGGWSDASCLWPTNGAIQIDNIDVSGDNGFVADFEDFEGNTLGDWVPTPVDPVGDFAKIWTGLEDLDPCSSNYSPQVAFIDDGVIVPGVGPSYCNSWCYGPNGYIVNTTGGAAGPDSHLWSAIESPIITWPGVEYIGASLLFDAYRHEDLAADSPGIFYTWGIRSTNSTDPADIRLAGWADRNFVYYGDATYIRSGDNDVTDLLKNDRELVQVQLACYELGYNWGWEGDNGYPAPYFDNVRLIAYPYAGAASSFEEIRMAQDNFPVGEVIDYTNLGNNDVRFDMALSPATAEELNNTPGDSIVFDIKAVRPGSDLVTGELRMYYKIDQNPLFDPYRVGFTAEGYTVADTAFFAGNAITGKWAFDIPDEDFLYPGDVMHWYIRAMDDDGVTQEVTLTPADTTGFSDFSGPRSYNSTFTFHALPSVKSATPGDHPKILFWNDFANRGGEAEWYSAFNQNGLVVGEDYDVYYTNGPSSGVGNGLGGRATEFQISGYDVLVYTAGNLGVNTISNGDYENDASFDVQVLDAWVRQTGKSMFLTGDDLVSDLVINAGTETANFVGQWMGLNYVDYDLGTLIGQTTPTVLALAGNGVFNPVDNSSWVAYGGCFGINTFDAIEAGTGTRLAEFANSAGAGGAYSYSAATLAYDATFDATVVTMPYDLMYIYDDAAGAKAPAAISARSKVLRDVLGYFGIEGDPNAVTDAPNAGVFATRNYPNPFNPTTKIEFNMPREGKLTLKIFNVRGELVRTLIDEVRPAGAVHIMWDGSNDSGSPVSSGVYFYEARTGAEVQVNKMTMVK